MRRTCNPQLSELFWFVKGTKCIELSVLTDGKSHVRSLLRLTTELKIINHTAAVAAGCVQSIYSVEKLQLHFKIDSQVSVFCRCSVGVLLLHSTVEVSCRTCDDTGVAFYDVIITLAREQTCKGNYKTLFSSGTWCFSLS